MYLYCWQVNITPPSPTWHLNPLPPILILPSNLGLYVFWNHNKQAVEIFNLTPQPPSLVPRPSLSTLCQRSVSNRWSSDLCLVRRVMLRVHSEFKAVQEKYVFFFFFQVGINLTNMSKYLLHSKMFRICQRSRFIAGLQNGQWRCMWKIWMARTICWLSITCWSQSVLRTAIGSRRLVNNPSFHWN